MVDAPTLTTSLGGEWHNGCSNVPCPVCQPERRRDQDALSIREDHGRLLLKCHKSNCDFAAILASAGFNRSGNYRPHRLTVPRISANYRRSCTSVPAKQLWGASWPIAGTAAEAYLRHRGITCDLPSSLRFLPDCLHPDGSRHPALLARIDGSSSFAVHRTFLSQCGRGKAIVEPQRAMLGPCAGGSVRLSEAIGPVVMVGEGIETCLSAQQEMGLPAWAALSATGLAKIQLPAAFMQVVVLADGDNAGENAAQAAAERWRSEGRQVRIVRPPWGTDFNDILVNGMPFPKVESQ